MLFKQMKVIIRGSIVNGFSNNPIKTKNYGSIYLRNSGRLNYYWSNDFLLSGFKT